MRNVAFIDGQNVHMSTKSCDVPWEIDLQAFRIYLLEKYHVDEAHYFIGYFQSHYAYVYEKIVKAGFKLHFREHNSAMVGIKKGNVDSDVIFQVMKMLCIKTDFEKVVLVSGDGDYKILVDFLIEQNKFAMILFPNRKFASSLYKKLSRKYFAYLEESAIRKKIGG